MNFNRLYDRKAAIRLPRWNVFQMDARSMNVLRNGNGIGSIG
mgnify:CR=1 FL=1